VPKVLDPDKDSGAEEADPYLLALASLLRTEGLDARIVTQETKRHSEKDVTQHRLRFARYSFRPTGSVPAIRANFDMIWMGRLPTTITLLQQKSDYGEETMKQEIHMLVGEPPSIRKPSARKMSYCWRGNSGEWSVPQRIPPRTGSNSIPPLR
jgi:hypothetical protein